MTITSHHTCKETSQCGNLMVENVLMKVWIYKQRQAVSVWEVSDDSRSRRGKDEMSQKAALLLDDEVDRTGRH